ncbi:hypothetical protein [Parablautia sp. Marseille-Q6255]|nr:hypothetical protein [Parablautia sp. Marseille-Q6255]
MVDVIINIAIGIVAMLGICAIAPTALIAWLYWMERKNDDE